MINGEVLNKKIKSKKRELLRCQSILVFHRTLVSDMTTKKKDKRIPNRLERILVVWYISPFYHLLSFVIYTQMTCSLLLLFCSEIRSLILLFFC